MPSTRLVFLALALTVWATPAKAQQSEIQVLSQRVQQLEHQVAELENRVRALEGTPQTPKTEGARPASGDWKQIGNWRRLRQGMTMDDASSILGQPGRVEANVVVISWYYGEFADGSVTFDPRSQKVTGWSEPRSQRP